MNNIQNNQNMTLPLAGLQTSAEAEYFFIFPPDELLVAEVNKLKAEHTLNYGSKGIIKNLPHIPLFGLVMSKVYEPYLMKVCENFFLRYRYFNLKINGFEKRSFNKTISIAIEGDQSALQMIYDLYTLLYRNSKIHPDDKAFPFTPKIGSLHIPLFKFETAEELDLVWQYYRLKTYSKRLRTAHVTLLKKERHELQCASLGVFDLPQAEKQIPKILIH